jgi:hypothetical protein
VLEYPGYLVRSDGGQRWVSTVPAIVRFRAKCRFDATTGCVLWVGGTTSGRGKSAPYGSFKYEGRRWFAHRWAAQFIHGLEIEGMHVDHCCPLDRAGPHMPLVPNTLCVEHVQSLTNADNVVEAWARRTWVLTQKGYYPPPPLFAELEAPDAPMVAPFYAPPAWLLDEAVNSAQDDCQL